MWRIMIYGVFMWAVTIYAFRRGGAAEKFAAVGIVINSYMAPLLVSNEGRPFQQVELSVAYIDAALFILLLIIALISKKFWPLWLAAFQGVTILAHFAPLLHVIPWVYARAVALWSWPMLVVLTFAVRSHSREGVKRGRKDNLPG